MPSFPPRSTAAPPRVSHRPAAPPRRGLRGALAAIAVAAVAALTAVTPVTAPGAEAAVHGHGYDIGSGWIGSHRVGDDFAYCLEIEAAPPTGQSIGLGDRRWSTMTANQNARVNWAVTRYGQRPDPDWAAAVHLFVWSLADAKAYNSHGMPGDRYYVARVPAAHRAIVLAHLETLRDGAADVTAGTSSGRVELDLRTDATDHGTGRLRISVTPRDARGTVELEHGVFAATGTSTAAGLGAGDYAVRGVAPGTVEEYRVRASAHFSGGDGYAGEVRLYRTAGGAQQHLAGPGPAARYSMRDTVEDAAPRTVAFRPVLSSEVATRFIEPGQPFVDTFRFALAAHPTTGVVNTWPRAEDGTALPVTAEVVVYSTTSPPRPGVSVPGDAEMFARAQVTSDGRDPTARVTLTTRERAQRSAYYVAVSTIKAAAQTAETRRYLDPDYAFADGWGVAAETSIVSPRATSQATPEQVQGAPVRDVARFDGVLFDGAQVAFRAYLRPAGGASPLESTDPQAIDPAAVCTPDTLVWSSAPAPLRERRVSSGDVTSLPVGVIDFVVAVLDADGTEVWTAPCGVVSERTRVVQLRVSTVAQSGDAGTPVHDTARIDGTVLPGDTIRFTAYRAQRDGSGTPRCERRDAVWSSEPIVLPPGRAEGLRVESGDTRLGPGTYWWVETVRSADGRLVHRGACGIESETSVVTPPPATPTKPTPPDATRLAATGVAGATPLLAAGALLLAGSVVMLAGARRRWGSASRAGRAARTSHAARTGRAARTGHAG